MSYFDHYRTCPFCKEGSTSLIHYSTRRYAHAACLVKAKGREFLDTLPLAPREQAVRELETGSRQ